MIWGGVGTAIAWSLAAVWEWHLRAVPPAFAHAGEQDLLLTCLAVAGVGVGMAVAGVAGLRWPRGVGPQPRRTSSSDR